MHITRTLPLAILLTFSLGAQERPSTETRTAESILREYRSVHLPSHPGPSDKKAAETYVERIKAVIRIQARLAAELNDVAPNHEALPELMMKRWTGQTNTLGEAKATYTETGRFLKTKLSKAMRIEACIARAGAALKVDDLTVMQRLDYVQEAVTTAPKDVRSGVYLMKFVEQNLTDPEMMRELAQAALSGWKSSKWVTAPASNMLKQLDKVGKPLKLSFEDVLSGETVDVSQSKSEYTLVHIWSGGWKCEANLEQLRELRARTPMDQLLMVSVYNWRHKAGREGLLAQLKKAKVDWPQCYDESTMKGPWSRSFSVPRTPFYYLLDKQGKVITIGYDQKVIEEHLKTIKRAEGSRDGLPRP